MSDQHKQSPNEERAASLAAQARRLSEEITRLAQRLNENIDNAGSAEAQAIAHTADRLFGAIARRDLARTRIGQGRVTFVGPTPRFCDALTNPDGVTCNRMLRDDGTCPSVLSHVAAPGHRPAVDPSPTWGHAVQYCREKVRRRSDGRSVTCSRFVVNGECPNAANHVAPADPIDVHPQGRV